MALMMDKKPTEYHGEALVWEKLSSLLPNDIVVYNHREIVDDRQFDFALIIKNVGILIIEVKGWQAKYVFDVKSPDEIVMQGEEKPLGSPVKQARSYRFDWINFLQDKFGISPVVLSVVCYPFITEKEYFASKLNVVSAKDFTIFSDDLVNANRLGQKINNVFIKKKPLNSTPLSDDAVAMIRQYFEPSYKVKESNVYNVSDQYSLLKVFGKEPEDSECKELVNSYFAGTKIITFTHDKKVLLDLATKLQQEFNKRKIIDDKGKLRLAKAGEVQQPFVVNSKGLRLFNFEGYLLDRNYINDANLIVSEGCVEESHEKLLETIAEETGFNYQQYKVEHAPVDSNVLVQAGAGTGKTYSMVSRIAFLCNKRQRAVNNLVDEIAMVTFTNEAADNMKVRLKQYFMNCYILTRKKQVLHQLEAVDLMQISTIHKFAKSILQSAAMSYGLGCDFAIASGEYAKEQIYGKYLNAFLVRKQEEDHNFAQQLQMPVHRFRKLLMRFSDQLYNKSYNIKKLTYGALGTFEEWPFFNDVIMEVMIPAEEEYEESLFSKNKIDLKESMILLNHAVNGSFRKKCNLKYKYLFVDEFQDTDDVQIDSFLKFQDILKDLKLFVVGDLKQSIYRFRGATVSAFELIEKGNNNWKEYSLNINYRTDYRLLKMYDGIFSRMGQQKILPFDTKKDSLKSTLESYIPKYDLITKISFLGDEMRMEMLFAEIDRQKAIIEFLCRNHNLSPKDKIIAILVRDNWQIHEVLEESKNRSYFIETEVGGDLYQLAPALDLYKLVLALLNPREPEYLFNLITSNYIKMHVDIQGLHGLEKDIQADKLIEVLDAYFIRICGKKWFDIVKETRIEPVLMLLRNIYEATTPWNKYDDEIANQKFYKANYELVLEKIIKTYSVDYLTLNVLENSLHINILTRQEELARNIEIETDDIRVICTTVHKAKGLEYGTVILPYMGLDIGSMKKAELDVYVEDDKLAYGIKIGDDANKKYNSNYDISEEQNERINEESRVLYVALTRAIRNVVWFKDEESKSKVSWQRLMEV